MRIQATDLKTKVVYGERYYIYFSEREAIKRYREHFGLRGKRNIVFRINRQVDALNKITWLNIYRNYLKST